MQNSKLGLDFTKVAHAKDVARKIADDVQKFVEQYSTVAVERTLCRLLGIDGIDANTVPPVSYTHLTLPTNPRV